MDSKAPPPAYDLANFESSNQSKRAILTTSQQSHPVDTENVHVKFLGRNAREIHPNDRKPYKPPPLVHDRVMNLVKSMVATIISDEVARANVEVEYHNAFEYMRRGEDVEFELWGIGGTCTEEKKSNAVSYAEGNLKGKITTADGVTYILNKEKKKSRCIVM